MMHNIMKLFPFMENQTRNLTTFLFGVISYTLIYSYVGSINFDKNSFIYRFFMFFIYIVLADAFAMGIIYKNYYNHTIFKEVEETMGASGGRLSDANGSAIFEAHASTLEPPITAAYAEPLPPKKSFFEKVGDEVANEVLKQKHIPKKQPVAEETLCLENDIDEDDNDSMEGFAKDTALGESYSTNCVSNS